MRGMSVSSRGGPGTDDPGRFTCKNCGVSSLIERAYDIQDYQLSGPEWMQSTRFDVSAKIAPGTTKEQFHVMMQKLLADRFKLTVHHGTKEMNVFNLVLTKSGPKFKESGEAADDDPAKINGPLKKDANGFPILGPGKGFSMAIMNNRAAMRNGQSTMDELARTLSNQLRQPVTNATGLKGKYDISMTWVPEGRAASDDDAGPGIFQALQEQLGLKLEAKKGTIQILIVDHLEKTPTEN